MKRNMQEYLHQSFGEDGRKIYSGQQSILPELIDSIADKSESQRKTMVQTILPRVALYFALQQYGLTDEEAVGEVGRYMTYQLEPLAKTYQRMAHLPFFFRLFRQLMLMGIKADNWQTSVVTSTTSSLCFEITDCLWYNTCVQHGCPNLCPAFCNNDYLLYGHMKGVVFSRQGTIAAGSHCCDFNFHKS